MQRRFERSGDRPTVALDQVTPVDTQNVNDALDKLRNSSNQPVASMAELLSGDFSRRRISSGAIERLSRWCNADGSYAASVQPACQFAIALLGFVPPRLIREDGKRPDDYSDLVNEIATRLRQSIAAESDMEKGS